MCPTADDGAYPRERSATERSIDAHRARRERARRRDEHALESDECEPCAFWFRQSLTQHLGSSTSEDARASRRRGGGRNRNKHECAAAEKAFVDKTDC